MGYKQCLRKKKDRDICVTSDFGRLNDLMVTNSYPVENVGDILKWLGSKGVLFVFDHKDGLFQVELHPAARKFTATQTALGIL